MSDCFECLFSKEFLSINFYKRVNKDSFEKTCNQIDSCSVGLGRGSNKCRTLLYSDQNKGHPLIRTATWTSN